MEIDAHGRAEGVPFIASPNCDARPPGNAIDLLVIHAISLPPGEFGGEGITDLFRNRLRADAHPFYRTIAHLRVSAHFLVRRDGRPLQYVACDQRAWHAGESSWQGRPRCNDFSIGIELEGTDEVPFAAAQYAALVELTGALRRRYPITEIAGHSDIAPGRKADPGPHFDWHRFRSALAA